MEKYITLILLLVSLDIFSQVNTEYVQKAIVSDGPGMGAIIRVCVDLKCLDHKGYRSDYKPSDKEKEERRKEAKKQKAKREKEEQMVIDG